MARYSSITQGRAQQLADMMLAVLRGSPKIKVLAIDGANVEDVDEEDE